MTIRVNEQNKKISKAGIFLTEAIIPTVCPRDCYDTCSMIIRIDKKRDKRSIFGDSINPITQGFTCPRGVKDIERLFNNNRVLHPFIRRHKSVEKVD